MEKLLIEETTQSPRITLDADSGIFMVDGNSFPNNSFRFYLPVLEWLDQYVKKPNKETHFVFRISYQNSSSLKMFNEILKKLEAMHKAGHKVKVDWMYQESDDDLHHKGKEIKELFSMPFECKSYAD